MERNQLLELAKKHRDEWVAEARFRLVEAIFNDAHTYLTYSLEEEVSDEDLLLITQMMEESVNLSLDEVTDLL